MNLLNKIKNLGSDSSHHGPSQDWYIIAEKGDGIIDEDTFSKSDVYLRIDFGGKQVRTRSIKDDRSPVWNETFHFKVGKGQAQDIHLKILDDDIGLDDGIAHAKVSRADLPTYPGEEKCLKIPMFHKEIVKGMVHLRVKYLDENQQTQTASQTSNIHSTAYPQQPYSTQPQMTNQPPPHMQPHQQQFGQPQQQQFGQPQQQQFGQPQQQNYGQSQQQPYTNQPQSNYGQQRY